VVVIALFASVGIQARWMAGSERCFVTGGNPDPNRAVLRVLTLNMRHARGPDGVVSLERVARAIEAYQPDLVALQEVDRWLSRSGWVHQARWLGERLGMYWVFGENLRVGLGGYGNALLSRYPILDFDNHRLTSSSEPRGCLEVTVRWGEQLVTVFVVHLGVDEEERRRQLATLETVTVGQGPVILCGDFNDEDLPELDAGWRWLRTSATFPAWGPVATIDRVYVSEAWRRAEAQVVEVGVSDHHAVLATMGLGDWGERSRQDEAPGRGG